jgi:ribosomal protein S19
MGKDFENIKNNKKSAYILQTRTTYITQDMLDLNIKLYNGMRYFSFKIENDMLGHCLGEFAPTKKKAIRKKKLKIKKSKSK